ncbi:hypothetical protein GCM10023329_47260 [Streptomyces sanyensis]|uniref:Uncharacterized protein n=1 Tax=Streptomyces sanyensis TaxID=568869 RepID=A0ABP9B593_9ACTN
MREHRAGAVRRILSPPGTDDGGAGGEFPAPAWRATTGSEENVTVLRPGCCSRSGSSTGRNGAASMAWVAGTGAFLGLLLVVVGIVTPGKRAAGQALREGV